MCTYMCEWMPCVCLGRPEKSLESLEPELQVVVNYPVLDICLGPLEEQQVFLTSIPSLQPHKLAFFKYFLLLAVFYIHLM